MKNMSDGQSDGFVIIYCRNGVVYPVALRQSELEMLDITIGMALKKVVLIKNNPFGSATNLIGGSK